MPLPRVTWDDKLPYPGTGPSNARHVVSPDELNSVRDAINATADVVDSIGGGDGSHLVIEQSFTSATVWTLDHSFPHRPSVEVLDAAGREVVAQVEHVSATRVVVTHNSPTSGSLRLD